MAGTGHKTRMRNHRFKPFLRSLKMKINILLNLLYKMYIKQKASIKHAHTHTVLRIFVNIPLQKTYILCVYLIYHTNTPIFSFNTTVSSCMHAFFCVLLHSKYTHFFSLLESDSSPAIFRFKKKKTFFYCLNRPFSMLN